jgi:hypothetical protein
MLGAGDLAEAKQLGLVTGLLLTMDTQFMLGKKNNRMRFCSVF